MKKDYASFVLVVAVGLFMAAAVLAKLFGGVNIDSDWFLVFGWSWIGC